VGTLTVSLADVTDEVVPSPDRLLVYGVEGVGKTTFAAGFPLPIFLDMEGSTARIPVKRLDLAHDMYPIVSEALAALLNEKHPYKTVVLDTADALEAKIQKHVMDENRWKSMTDAGYGKAYDKAAEIWKGEVLPALDALRMRRGMDVVVLAHSKVVRFSAPDQPDYDRYEPKLYKSVTPLLKEWAEAVLFAAFEQTVIGANQGITDKGKAVTTGRRVAYTQRAGAYDAKNRWGLPPAIPLEAKVYLAERDAYQEKNPTVLYMTGMRLLGQLVESQAMTTEEAGVAETFLGGIRWEAPKLKVAVDKLREKTQKTKEPK
jgi:hypothetical protein